MQSLRTLPKMYPYAPERPQGKYAPHIRFQSGQIRLAAIRINPN